MSEASARTRSARSGVERTNREATAPPTRGLPKPHFIAPILKEHSQLWDRAVLDTSFSHFEKSSPQPEIKENLEIRFNLRGFLLDFQSFTKKPVFECAFAQTMV